MAVTIKDIAKTIGVPEKEVEYSFWIHERNKQIIKECRENANHGAYESGSHYIEDLMIKARQDAMKVCLEAIKKEDNLAKKFKSKIISKYIEFDEYEETEQDFYPKLGEYVFKLIKKLEEQEEAENKTQASPSVKSDNRNLTK
jgi:hypothetical protein